MEHYIKCARKSLEDELSKKLNVEPSHDDGNELEELKKELEELQSSTQNEESKLAMSAKRVKQASVALTSNVKKIGSEVSATTQGNTRGAEEIALLKAKLTGIRKSFTGSCSLTSANDMPSSFAAQILKLRQEAVSIVRSTKQVVLKHTSSISTEDWRVRVQELKDINSSISASQTEINQLTRELDNIRMANGSLADEVESMHLQREKVHRDFNQNIVSISKKELCCKSLKEKVTALESDIVALNDRRAELLREKVVSADKKAALHLTLKEVESDVKKTQLELDSQINKLSVLRDRSSQMSNAISMQNNLTDLKSKIARARYVQLLRHQLADSIGYQKVTEDELLSSIAQLKEDIMKESKSLDSKNDTAHDLENCRLAKVDAMQSECERLKAVIFSHEELCSYGEIRKSQLQNAVNAQKADIAKRKGQIDDLEKALTVAKRVTTAKAKNNKDKKAVKRKQDMPAKKTDNVRPTRSSAASVAEIIDILDDTIQKTTSFATKEVVETDKDLFLDDSLDNSIQSSEGEDDEEFGSRFGPSQVIQATQSIEQMPASQDNQPVDDSLFASDVDSDNDDDFFGKARTLDNTFDADAHRIVASTPILQNRRETSPEVRSPFIEVTSRNKRVTRKSNPDTNVLPTRSVRKRATRRAQ